jgi:PAS domain-containing protein
MVPFNYREISQALVAELGEGLSRGDSFVLLGPRFVGKRHIINGLHHVLEAQNGAPVIRLKFLSDATISSEEQVRKQFDEAIPQRYKRKARLKGRGAADQLFGPLDDLRASLGASPKGAATRRVYLFASNIDSLPPHMVRSFLRGVRRRIESGWLVVMLSGEDDLQHFVQTAPGGFTCTHQYVLKGFDLPEFRRNLMLYLNKLDPQFEEPAEPVVRRLFDLTGGNLYSMRMALWGLLERRVREEESLGMPLSVEDLPQSLNLVGIPNVYGAHVFRHGTQLIAFDRECWGRLEDLIRDGRVDIGVGEGAPTTLEMAGIAVRDVGKGGASLRYASLLQKDFVQKYYDARRLGDLYASASDWEAAFARYERVPEERRIRPAGINDLAHVQGAVHSLCSSLFVEVAKHTAPLKGLEAVKKHFTKGSHYVLGFSEISFWERSQSRGAAGWQYAGTEGWLPDEEVRLQIQSLLPSDPKAAAGECPLHAPESEYALARILPTMSEDSQVAVVLSDLNKRVAISRQRAELSKVLLEHLADAYVHAHKVSEALERRKTRDRHVNTMKSIFDSLGSDVKDVRHVLDKAAEGLGKLGYSRALFSLVNAEEEKIEGILERSDDQTVELWRDIQVDLHDPKDLHAEVIRTGKTIQVADAPNDPSANPYIVEKGNIKSFALVPIINPAKSVVGTLHVERRDSAMPSKKELEDLKYFGEQLAVAIDQSERVNMLETSLNKIPEPIVITDRAGRRRYANEPASVLLGIPEGWNRAAAGQPPLAQEVGAAARGAIDLLEESLKGHRLVSHVEGIGRDETYRGAVLTDYIEDWRGQTSGGLMHIQDFNYLHKVFRAAQRMGSANDILGAMVKMLDVVQLLGHRWGRIYVVDDQENPQVLTSKVSFGFDDPAVEQRFLEGKFVLEKRPHIDWWSIDQRTPVVFCWRNDQPNGTQHVTKFGLRAHNVQNPKQPPELGKKPGDYWIDFPLIMQEKVLGKICLQCDENLRPEEFELLKIISGMAADLFTDAVQQENFISERLQESMNKAVEKTIGTIAHNLVTRFGGLSPVHARYELLESKFPDIAAYNEYFARQLHDAMQTAVRARDLLGPINLRPATFGLVGHLAHVLRPALPDGKLRITCDCDELEVTADGHLLGMAFMEMVQNSKDAEPDAQNLEVRIMVEPCEAESADDEMVHLRYTDNGPGIPPEISEKVFDEFFSYHPGRSTGTGLGLYFVQRVLKSHGGSILVGAPSQGAEFNIFLRRRPRPDAPTLEETNVSHSDSRR